MDIKILFLIFLFSWSRLNTVQAKQNADYTITFSVNLADCLNCNKTLYDLNEFKADYHIRIVLQQQFKIDSTLIETKYKFSKVADEVIWSDSLFNEYSSDGNTNFAVESKYQVGRFSCRIHDIYQQGFLSFLKRQYLEIDTLFPSYPSFARGVEQFKIADNLLGLQVAYKGEIHVYDYISQKLKYKISIDEKTLQKVFNFNRREIPSTQYENQKEAMIAANVPNRYELDNFSFASDTVIVKMVGRYFEYPDTKFSGQNPRNDTALQAIPAILHFQKGKVVKVSKLEFADANGNNASFNIYQSNGKLWDRIFPTNDSFSSATPYLASLELDSIGVYRIKEKTDRRIPAVYAKTDSYGFLSYYKNTYCFPLVNKIFALEDGKEIEQLDYLPIHRSDAAITFDILYFNEKHAINEDFVWTIDAAMLDKKNKMIFYKMNRKTRKVENVSVAFSDKQRMLMVYDPLNPDYIIYKTDDGNLVRKRIF